MLISFGDEVKKETKKDYKVCEMLSTILKSFITSVMIFTIPISITLTVTRLCLFVIPKSTPALFVD